MTALKAAELATRPVAQERDALLDAAGRRVEGILELAGAEVRLIAVSSLTMLVLAILAAAAVIIAWVLVVASILEAAVRAGLPYILTALVLALVHVVIAVYCGKRITRLSRHLTMPALRGAIHRPKGAT
jgi:hypothetical protein